MTDTEITTRNRTHVAGPRSRSVAKVAITAAAIGVLATGCPDGVDDGDNGDLPDYGADRPAATGSATPGTA
ncbi:hypothetical protein [Haloechinothrix sp. LS1_15]|uniref:hypothetical protein n=1 Tax=Haloechinothrix sp. LS1_15 TaxID=2652248 RepID=UPI00294439A7|nr:hypothetical protein [Haloechinothrix sp. LS1_15]MDV6014668.1 hypothetical protein [Haloechinothrix sp. LS1_15]